MLTRHARTERHHMGSWKKSMRLSSLTVLALVSLCVPALGAAQGSTAPNPGNVALVNGQWFDGTSFHPRTVYSVGGRFTSNRPARVDTTLDLAGTWVVPPFGEAHNHNVDGVVEARTRQALARYVADGVFYVQIQGNFAVGEELTPTACDDPRDGLARHERLVDGARSAH